MRRGRLSMQAWAGLLVAAVTLPLGALLVWSATASGDDRFGGTVAVGVLALLGVWGAAALAVRRVLGPLEDIAEAATAVTAGDTSARVPGGGPREVHAIGEGFNRMLDQRAQAEAALRASEARYRALFETSSDAILGIDEHSRILFANPAVEPLTGWSASELVGRELGVLQPEDLRDAHSDAIRRVASDGGAPLRRRSIETRCRHRSGREFPVEITFSVSAIDGSATFVGFMRDISRRHAVLAELTESEQRFRTIADSSPVLIWTADAVVRDFYFNATWLAFTGQTLDEARVGGWFAGVHPDDIALVQAVIDRANANREGCTLEYRRRRHDGQWRWLLDTSAPRHDTSGRFLGYVGSAVDIHDRVVAEARIRRLTRLYSALSQANEAIARSGDLGALLQRVCDIVVRETGLCTAVVAMANDGNSRLASVAASGEFAAYFAALSVPIASSPNPEETPGSVAFRTSRTVVSNDRARDTELRPIARPEVRERLRSTAILPLSRQGRTAGVVAVYANEAGFFDDELTDLLELLATDVSYALDAFAARERRDVAEEELRRLNATLEERVAERTRSLEAANRELEAFSYSVSHDLRAPLRSINGFAALLNERYRGQLDDEGRDYLERVRAASARMSRLIGDLLDLSRVARQVIHRSECDLTAMATEIVEELGEHEPDRDVVVSIAPGLEATADPGLARIVLRNLIDNAWKFTSRTPGARIDVEAGSIDGRPGITVRDNGAGFDATYADRLFAPFQRLHGEREFPGNGIGLAIVQRIVHRHQGEVRASAAPGQGASFTFTLGSAA